MRGKYPFRRRVELARLFVAIIGVAFKCQVFLWDIGTIFHVIDRQFPISQPPRLELALSMLEGLTILVGERTFAGQEKCMPGGVRRWIHW